MESDDDFDLALFGEAVAWNNLTDALRDGRPAPDPKYLRSLVSDVVSRRRTLRTGEEILRARLMPPEHEANVIEPYPISEMGSPPPARAAAARLSRKGTPVFYGALTTETAVAEMRPWARARITVATFCAASSLEVADLTSGGLTSTTPSLQYLEFLLGRPVHLADSESYLASQELADAVNAAGLAGILYNSSLSIDGTNVMLFSAAKLTGKATALYEVSSVTYKATRLVER